MAYNLHQKHCGKERPKPFKCTFADCGKSFTRKSTLENHQEHAHLPQLGGEVKRNAEEEQKQVKKTKLPEKEERVLPADKEVSAMKGAKVDAFFNPKTETQR